MKNVLLVDNELKLIEHVLKNTDWNVVVLITSVCPQKYKSNSRIKNVFEESKFWENDDLSYFDYNDLSELWFTQLRMENCYVRFSDDYQLAKWNFYRGYALVKRIFSEQRIDLAIIKGHNHGYSWDRLIVDYATKNGIESYNIEIMLNETRIIVDNLHNEILEHNQENVCLENSLFYKEKLDNDINTSQFWGKIYKLAYKFWGEIGKDFVKCVRYKNLGKDKFGVSIIDRRRSLRSLNKTKQYFEQNAVEFDKNKKAICFAMHLEPEAVIAGRAMMDSQIVAIKMLAQNLPDDWILYIKEHPMQFSVNHTNLYSYLYGENLYKTKKFYEEIVKTKNVYLLKLDSETKTIIKNCEAVASMSGTIIAEAIVYRKPVLVFSPERTIYKYVQDVFTIRSNEDCRNATKSIMYGFTPLYNNFTEICNKLLISFSDETSGYKCAINTIWNRCAEETNGEK